jgi:hypothetical protein
MVYTIIPQIMGTINLTMFDSVPIGQMLCMPPKVYPLGFTPGGTPVRDLEYIFLVRAKGVTWNQYYRRGSSNQPGSFQEVVGSPSTVDVQQKIPGGQPGAGFIINNKQQFPGPPPYASSEFLQLFQP